MAFTLNPEAQSVFFVKVFGSTSDVAVMAKQLVASGVTFELAMYTVKATWKYKEYSVSLTKGTTSLMKGSVEQTVLQQNKNLIAEWIKQLHSKVLGQLGQTGPDLIPVPEPVKISNVILLKAHPTMNLILLIKAIRTVTGMGLVDGKKIAEQAIWGTPQVLKTLIVPVPEAVKTLTYAGAEVELVSGTWTAEDLKSVESFESKAKESFEAKPDLKSADWAKEALGAKLADKPVDTVMDLKAAMALGQKVHGTSSGSVYHCIAISEHVKVAARLYKGGSISIRAEWTDNPKDELKKLQESGLQMKATYGSIHFDAADVPLQRVIGAFLMGTGINWKAAVMSGAELVIGDKF